MEHQYEKLYMKIFTQMGRVKYAIVTNIIDFNPVHSNVDEYAVIISNGDYSMGTVLARTSSKFREIYCNADMVIAKGQANYETLSEEDKNIYFLLMAKCKVIAGYIGVQEKSMVCLKNQSSFIGG